MSVNGQQSRSFGKLSNSISSASLKRAQTISQKHSALLAAIDKVVDGYAQDLYGNNTDDKYRYIVDLIIKRFKKILEYNVNNLDIFTNDDFVVDIENDIKEKNLYSYDINISEIIKQLIENSKEVVQNYFDSTLLDIRELIDNKNIEQKENKEQIEEKSEEENKKQEEEEKQKIRKELYSKVYDNLEVVSRLIENNFFVHIENFEDTIKDTFALINSSISSITNLLEFKFKLIDQKMNSKEVLNSFQKIFNTVKSNVKTKKQKKEENNFLQIVIKLNKIMTETINRIVTTVFKGLMSLFDFTMNLLGKKLALIIFRFLLLVLGPLLLILGLGLKFGLVPLFTNIITPFIEFVGNCVKNVINALTDIFTNVLAPIIDFFVEVAGPPLARIINAIVDFAADIINAIAESIGDIIKVVTGIILLPAKLIASFVEGIGNKATELGKKMSELMIVITEVMIEFFSSFDDSLMVQLGKSIVEYVVSVIEVKIAFFEGIGDCAFKIGQALSEFLISSLDVFITFFDGFKTFAYDVGKAQADFVLTIFDSVDLIIKILVKCSAVLVKIAIAIVAFFEGFGSNARKVGEEIAKYNLMVAKKRLEFLRAMQEHAYEIGEAFAEYLSKDIDTLRIGVRKLAQVCSGSSLPEVSKKACFQLNILIDSFDPMILNLEKIRDAKDITVEEGAWKACVKRYEELEKIEKHLEQWEDKIVEEVGKKIIKSKNNIKYTDIFEEIKNILNSLLDDFIKLDPIIDNFINKFDIGNEFYIQYFLNDNDFNACEIAVHDPDIRSGIDELTSSNSNDIVVNEYVTPVDSLMKTIINLCKTTSTNNEIYFKELARHSKKIIEKMKNNKSSSTAVINNNSEETNDSNRDV